VVDVDLESVEQEDLNPLALMDSLPYRLALMAADRELVPTDLSRALAPLRGEAEGGEGTGEVVEVGGPALMGSNPLAPMGRPRGSLAAMVEKPGPALMAVNQQSAQERM